MCSWALLVSSTEVAKAKSSIISLVEYRPSPGIELSEAITIVPLKIMKTIKIITNATGARVGMDHIWLTRSRQEGRAGVALRNFETSLNRVVATKSGSGSSAPLRLSSQSAIFSCSRNSSAYSGYRAAAVSISACPERIISRQDSKYRSNSFGLFVIFFILITMQQLAHGPYRSML